MEILFALASGSKKHSGTVVWAQIKYPMHICVEVEVLLLVLTFDSTGNV